MSCAGTSIVDVIQQVLAGENVFDAWTHRSLKTRAGQRIYDFGDPVDDFYLLVDGLLQVTAASENEETLLLLSSPSLWGDAEIASQQTQRTSGLKAVGEAQLLCFSINDFDATNEDFMHWHRAELAKRSTVLVQTRALSRLNLDKQVAHLTNMLDQFDIELDAQQTAEILGASSKAVQRALKDLPRVQDSIPFIYSLANK